ncbi:general secretion pathway protein GspE [bacterium]|nr:general secretion pathway protein GspE [bacterium]
MAATKIDVYKEWLGIPEGPRPPDHYALLRLVQFEDDAEKIRKNYKKLNGHVRKYATGQYAGESQELLNELARAMLCLTDAERKRDYDRELGRDVDAATDDQGSRPLTSYLQSQGLLTADQVNEVKSHAERTGLSLRDSVVQLKLADQETATRAYASELGYAYVDIADMIPDEDTLDSVPKSVVRRYTCLPLFVDGERVLVACANEPSHELEDEIRLRFGLAMRAVLATPKAIKEGIDQYYAQGLRKEKAAAPVKSKSNSAANKLVEKVTQKKHHSELTAEEKDERKKLGIVLCCMTFVVLGNLDAWVLYDMMWKYFAPSFFPFVSTILLGGPIMFGVYQSYIRPR